MKNKNITKTMAVAKLKSKMLLNNTAALTGPLMAIGMTFLMKLLYGSMTDDPEQTKMLMGLALRMGLSFNIGMGAVMMTALPLAEDKEKYTLRSLMTSSVNGLQFFIGSLMPPLIITIIVNYILIFISGVSTENIDWVMYSAITIVGSLTSCMLGLLLGIIAKSQVNANNIMMPFLLVLAMVPSFSEMNASLAKVSKFLYTGIASNMVSSFVSGESYGVGMEQIIVLVISIVIIALLFVFYYKKTILETE